MSVIAQMSAIPTPGHAMDEELLTVNEAADRLGVSVATIRRGCASGQIPASKVGRSWLIPSASLPPPARRPRPRRPRLASATVDLGRALTHLRSQDLKHDVWVPDALRFEDDLQRRDPLFASAAARLDLEEPFDPATSVPVPKSPFFPRNAVDLSLTDRLAYQAVVGAFDHLVHSQMTDSSYAARPARRAEFFLANGRDLWLAWREHIIVSIYEDGPWMVETDITAFFDFIKHELLLPELQHLGVDNSLINPLREMLRTWSVTPNTGLPQGPNASRLLGNFYLAPVDAAMRRLPRVKYFRYMDDIRIVGSSRAAVIEALQVLDAECRRRGLALSTRKTMLHSGPAAISSLEESELDAIQYAFDSGDEDEPALRKQLLRLFRKALQKDGTIDTRHARFSLNRLFRMRDRGAIGSVLANLEFLAPLRDLVPKYLFPWLRQPRVIRELSRFLRDPERNTSSFLSTWLMAAMTDLPPPLPAEWIDYARAIAFDRSQPSFHRSVAINLVALDKQTRDISNVEDIASGEFDPEIVRAAVVALARTRKLTKTVAARASRIPGLGGTISYLRGVSDLPSLLFSGRRTPLR